MTPSAAALAGSHASPPLQALDPSIVVDAPASVRAAAAFLLTVVFGGAVIYWYGGRIDAAVDASKANPLLSAVYGLIAYGLVAFFIVYAYSQVVRIGVGTEVITVLAVVVLGVVLLSLGGLGFVVVGAWLTDSFDIGDTWAGLVGVALASGLVLLVLPVGVGLLVWLGIAAVGVGGPTRAWMHAEAVDTSAR
jgi:hypothetical protein